jgi:GntR family transcriptional regulator, transcriptional repressor for pyruvate dehydrogenase complex
MQNALTRLAAPADRARDNHRTWLESPRTDKLSERLARTILSDIVEGHLAVGAMLPSEATMMESYGVGRNSLREALRILEVHGLVKIKPGPKGGPVVASISSNDLASSASFFFNALGVTFGDLLQARLIIEPVMARLAAARVGDASARAIITTLARHDAAGPETHEWMPESAGFHVLVNSLSGNPVLDLVCRALIEIYAERTPSSYPSNDSGQNRRAHGRIAKAIIDGDADLAERRMRSHIKSQLTNVKRYQPALIDEPIDWR